ncbi:hypothetical protein ACOMHN_053480 [Nucella lapillus]
MDTPPSDSSSSTPGCQGDEDHSTVPPLPSHPEISFLSDGMSAVGPESSPWESTELDEQRSFRELEAFKMEWFAFDRQQRIEDIRRIFQFKQQFTKTGQSMGEFDHQTFCKLYQAARDNQQQRDQMRKLWLAGNTQQRARISQRMGFTIQPRTNSTGDERHSNMLERASRRIPHLWGYGNGIRYVRYISRTMQSPYSSGPRHRFSPFEPVRASFGIRRVGGLRRGSREMGEGGVRIVSREMGEGGVRSGSRENGEGGVTGRIRETGEGGVTGRSRETGGMQRIDRISRNLFVVRQSGHTVGPSALPSLDLNSNIMHTQELSTQPTQRVQPKQEPRAAEAEVEQLQGTAGSSRWISLATDRHREEVIQRFQHMDLGDPEPHTEQ